MLRSSEEVIRSVTVRGSAAVVPRTIRQWSRPCRSGRRAPGPWLPAHRLAHRVERVGAGPHRRPDPSQRRRRRACPWRRRHRPVAHLATAGGPGPAAHPRRPGRAGSQLRQRRPAGPATWPGACRRAATGGYPRRVVTRPPAAVLAVDGGNSKADLALVARDGTLLAAVRGPTISHQQVGVEEGIVRLGRLAAAAARRAGIPGSGGGPLAEVGLYSVAGADFAGETRMLNHAFAETGLTEPDRGAQRHASRTAGGHRSPVGRGPDLRRGGECRRGGPYWAHLPGWQRWVPSPATAVAVATWEWVRWARLCELATAEVRAPRSNGWCPRTLA